MLIKGNVPIKDFKNVCDLLMTKLLVLNFLNFFQERVKTSMHLLLDGIIIHSYKHSKY